MVMKELEWFAAQKRYLEFPPLTYNGEPAKMTWPEVTDMEIPRYTFYKYWRSNVILKVSSFSLKNCGRDATANFLGGGVTWPDLTQHKLLISAQDVERINDAVDKIWQRCAPPFCAIREKPDGEGVQTPPAGRRLTLVWSWDSQFVC